MGTTINGVIIIATNAAFSRVAKSAPGESRGRFLLRSGADQAARRTEVETQL